MSATVNSHLELAHALAADDVGGLIERGELHRVADYARKYLENKFALLPPEELRGVVEERAPYLLEP